MSTSTAPRSGWLIVMPGGHRYTWYARSRFATKAAAWKVFAPDTAKRNALITQGWTVVAGDAVELIAATAPAHRASA